MDVGMQRMAAFQREGKKLSVCLDLCGGAAQGQLADCLRACAARLSPSAAPSLSRSADSDTRQ